MSNEVAIIDMPFDHMLRLADSIAKSGMFGIKTADQALVLMSIAQAEGRHPALAARDYHIIQNTPAKKAEAMLRDFLSGGGHVEWHRLTDDVAEATFSHPAGGSVTLQWDKARVRQAGINNPMHSKYPRQMLRSRLISEGVRTVWPMATGGFYVPEEVADFDRSSPRGPVIQHDPVTGEVNEIDEGRDSPLFDAGQKASEQGTESLRQWWMGLSSQERGSLGARGRSSGPHMEKWKEIAAKVDEQAEPAARTAGQRPEAEAPGSPTAEPEEPSRGDNFGLPDTRTRGQIFADNVWAQVDVCKTETELKTVMEMWEPQINNPQGPLSHAEFVALRSRIDQRKSDLMGAA